MQEIITNTTKIYDGRLIRLSVHDVRLPNNDTSKREVIQHPGAVAVVALDNQQNVLLVRQFRLPAGQVMYEIPAGTLNPNEDPHDCAIREMQEETGYKPTTLQSLGGIYTAPGYTTEFIHLFMASELVEAALEQDRDEFVEMERTPLKDALAMIERGEITDSKTVCGLMRVARQLGV